MASETVASLIGQRSIPQGSGAPAAPRPRRILVLSSVFPSSAQPTFGVFVKERIRAIANLPGCEVCVVSPTPWFPPIKSIRRWYPWSQTPRSEQFDGLQVEHPRYVLPPKLGGYVHPWLMHRSAQHAVSRIRREFDFDLIDAHFTWPNGALACRLGREFGKPVVITGRGEDMLRFPKLPIVGDGIRRTVRDAAHCVALSREIADAFRAAGAPSERISIVPNGVDCDIFRPGSQLESRRALGLPKNRRIILAVGDLQERKGFHLLVEAASKLRSQFPDLLVIVVGGPPRSGRNYAPAIEALIRLHGLENHVTLAGPSCHQDLATWYNAADLFVLLSSREGSPNVLLEALACGVPAVAAPAGETVDLLADGQLGILLRERTADCAAEGIREALSRNWDRVAIHAAMRPRAWHRTAETLVGIFDRVLDGVI